MAMGAACLALVACAGGSDTTEDESEADVTRAKPQVVLQYDAARKAELIEQKYFTAADFTGNAVVASDAKTTIDIDRLLPDNDAAPNSICYKGAFASVKKIINAMMLNTDGNGDHFLGDERTIETVGTAGEVHVFYTTTGEGGRRPNELFIPRCT